MGFAHIHMYIITDLEIHVFTVIELVYSLLISKKKQDTHQTVLVCDHFVASGWLKRHHPGSALCEENLGRCHRCGAGATSHRDLWRDRTVPFGPRTKRVKKKVSPLLVALLLVTSMNFIWTSIAYSFSVAGAFFAMPLEGNAEMIVRCPESSAGFVLQPRRCTD